MVQVSYPGVYVQEVPSGVRPIAAVSTSIGAFVDFFARGPLDTPVEIFGMADFEREFGGLHRDSPGSYAIKQFFLNGGSRAFVIRVARDETAGAARPAFVAGIAFTSGTATIRARSAGTWANSTVRVRLEPAPAFVEPDGVTTHQRFSIVVTQYESQSPSARPIGQERFLNLDVEPARPRYFVDVVNEESSLVVIDDSALGATPGLPAAFTGTLGGPLSVDYTSVDSIRGSFNITITDLATTPITASGALQWQAGEGPENDAELRGRIERAIREVTSTDVRRQAFTGATVDLIGNRLYLRMGSRGPDYVPAAIMEVSGLPSLAGITGAEQELVLAGGRDGLAPGATELIGDPNLKTGLYALEDVDQFNILCLPRAADLEPTAMNAVLSEAIEYCRDRRAFVLVDVPREVTTHSEVRDWVDANPVVRDSNAAVFFPRTMVPDPLNEFRLRPIGAGGTMAGVFARTDATRGVWKAPAGVDATLRGVSGLATVLTDAENGALNPLAINCLRSFPIHGMVAWGARTGVGADEAASEWKYVPVRRLALMIEESLFRGTKWAVFQPNDEPLWARLRQNVGAFMMRLFRDGAFQGSTPRDAFYVKCDAETTTAADRNLGIVNIEVGFAPLKPAEFVVIKIQQIPDVG